MADSKIDKAADELFTLANLSPEHFSYDKVKQVLQSHFSSSPSDEEIDTTFPINDTMPEKGQTYNAGKRLGAKWMRKKMLGLTRST